MRPIRRRRGAERLDVKLNIWRREHRICFQKSGTKTGGHGHWSRLAYGILQRDHALFENVIGLNVDGRKIGLENRPRLQMVLQIFSNSGQIAYRLYTLCLQFLRGANA